MHGVHSAMHEKRRLSATAPKTSAPSRLARRITAIVFALLLVSYFTCYRLYPQTTSALPPQAAAKVQSLLGKEPIKNEDSLVPLEAHIISKCPDTRDALRQLILPAMQKISDKVDFTLSYIGTPTANDGVDCKHGPAECMGNILELCARELYPDPKINLGFIMCVTKDYKHIPERALIEDCALEHAIDFQALNECATRDDGAHGMSLLRNSVMKSSEANVSVSCTIRLNNQVYCVRDGGEWSDCPHGPGVNDLVLAVEKLYHSSDL